MADLKISVVRVQLHKSETDSYKLVILPLSKPGPVSKGDPVRVSQMAPSGNQPRRLVVDYFGLTGKGSKNLSLNDKRVKSIRIGDHSDRTRIVIDFKGDNPIASTQATRLGNGDAFRVDFSLAKNKKKEVPKEVPTAAPTATKVPTPVEKPTPSPAPVAPKSTPTPEGVTRLIPTPEEMPQAERTPREAIVEPKHPSEPLPDIELNSEVKEPEQAGARDGDLQKSLANPSESVAVLNEATTPLSEERLKSTNPSSNSEIPSQPTEVEGQSVLGEIGFQKLKDSGASAVFFTITPIPSYTLEQRSEDQYELKIPGARLAQNGLSLPRFSPEGIEGLDLVVARPGDSGIIVRIFVESGVRLFPFVAEGKLWVKAHR